VALLLVNAAFQGYLSGISKKAAQARERGEQEPEPECRFLFPHQPYETAEMILHPGKVRRGDPLRTGGMTPS